MARKTVTEEELGLTPTEEELATAEAPDTDDVPDEPEIETAPETEGDKAEETGESEKQEEKPAEEPKMVDVRALQEARAEAREAREQAKVMEQRWNDFLTAQQKPKEEEKPVPKWNEDPVAAGEWTQEQLLAMREEQSRTAQEQEQARKQQEEQTRLLTEAQFEFQAAEQADPNMRPAYEALVNSFKREVDAYQLPPVEAQKYLQNLEMQHIAFAKSRGIPLKDYVISLASARGFAPQAGEQQAAPAAKPDLASVAVSQQRHQSLSDAPGGESVAPLDAKALAKMSDKEFKAWMSKKGNDAKFEEIMGG